MSLDYLDDIKAMFVGGQENQNHFKLLSSIQALEQSKMINQAFLDKKNVKDQATTLIHIFGLLQNLFVSIDALYDMSKITMSHKFSVNVNMNKNLHALKYIRNDIVGHPTHRTYQSGGVGFSMMTLDKTSMSEIVYETHIFKRKKHEKMVRRITTQALISDYETEASQIIKEIYDYLIAESAEPHLSNMALTFYENLRLDTFDYKLLTDIKRDYASTNNISKNSHNRLLWRIRLLEMLDNWKEKDEEKQAFIKYMKMEQAIKIYQMTSEMEGIQPKYLSHPLPELLSSFYRFIKQDESLMGYLKNLKDMEHPYQMADLTELIDKASGHPKVKKLLYWLKRQTNEHRVFTIGSVLEKYKSVQA